MILHRFEESLPPELCRFEAHRAANESDLTVPKLKKMFNGFMNTLFIIDSDVLVCGPTFPMSRKTMAISRDDRRWITERSISVVRIMTPRTLNSSKRCT